ncbi:hypothetical protein CQ011_05075 [Arthrobacter sp. MYb213]|nr:hypothetical protein CQ011_05075 [Arthrobacter sp. MYb213]
MEGFKVILGTPTYARDTAKSIVMIRGLAAQLETNPVFQIVSGSAAADVFAAHACDFVNEHEAYSPRN